MEPFWFPLSGSSLGAPLALIGAETPFFEPLFAPFELKKRLLLELYRLLLERDSTTEPSFLKADTSSSLELYWLPWSEGSPWSDSSILELH